MIRPLLALVIPLLAPTATAAPPCAAEQADAPAYF